MGRRLHRWRDDRGSLPFALMVTLVGTAVSALLVPMVVVQLGNTRADSQRVQAVEAAQAGLDAALGQLRRANDGNGKGIPSALPCNAITGSVGGDGVSTYSVGIQYFETTASSPLAITCPTAQSGVPLDHALLTSTGTSAGVRSRQLSATYTFWVNDENVAGGLIPTFPYGSDTTPLCMDAGSATPTDPTPITMRTCTPGLAQQTFSYNLDLTVSLVSTASAATGLLCLDAGPVPHVWNAVVYLKACAAKGTSAHIGQMWSLNNHANFEGTSDGLTNDNYCIVVKNAGQLASPVVLGSGDKSIVNPPTCQQQHDDKESWNPDASVGAGAAGESTQQLVNYGQFGRCLDVPRSDVTYGYLIIWPCKQAPDPSTIGWNERWVKVTSPLHGNKLLITTTDKNNNRYCLQTVQGSSTYVTVQPCGPSVTIDQTMEWTVTGEITGDPYHSYTIIDYNGNCLSPNDATVDPYVDPVAHVQASQGISKATVAACGAAGLLKWNALAGTLSFLPLTSVAEK